MQPQRVPLGSFKSPQGNEVLVYIRREWYILLEALVTAAGGSADPGDVFDFDLDPPALQRASSGHALQSDNGPTPVSAADLSSILQRVQALESDSTVSRLQAEIARLKTEIEALKEA